MRLLEYGRPFTEVSCEGHVPGGPDIEEMRQDNIEHGRCIPVFSERFLYPRVGKDDARFILAVADEYEALIEHLGEDVVREILKEKRR